MRATQELKSAKVRSMLGNRFYLAIVSTVVLTRSNGGRENLRENIYKKVKGAKIF